MPKLKVTKTLRLVDIDPQSPLSAELRKVGVLGAIYLEGETVEPNAREAVFLVKTFPDCFAPAE